MMERRSKRILIVDDDPSIRRLFTALLESKYEVRGSACGTESIDIASNWSPDLVLLDIMMPGIDGFDTCLRIKALPCDTPPAVIMVTGKSAPSEQAKAFESGADDYMIKPVDPAELRSRIELHFRLRESQSTTNELLKEINSHHIALKQEARERIEQTIAVQDVAVFTLAKVAESRDNETGEHIERMREYAQLLAQELSGNGVYSSEIDDQFLTDLYRSTPLHDIGKVGIPDSILLKPGKLTHEEFEIMKRHTLIGSNILHEAATQLSGGGFLAMASQIAMSHHERWDGNGYPEGLAKEEIPLAARIASVADVFDALTSRRPYKEAWSPIQAKKAIDEGKGTQFDPKIVAAFDDLFEDFVCVQFEYPDKSLESRARSSLLECAIDKSF